MALCQQLKQTERTSECYGDCNFHKNNTNFDQYRCDHNDRFYYFEELVHL